jgi:hypothetical protein
VCVEPDAESGLSRLPIIPHARQRTPQSVREQGDGVRMSTWQQEVRAGAADRNLAAVSRSLEWARESAARGDYADALAWVQVVEAIGDQLQPEYQTKRQAWLSALARTGE